MKIKYLTAKYGIDFKLPNNFIETLKKTTKNKKGKIAVYCAVQFVTKLNYILDEIKKNGLEPITSKPDRATFKGQILGCDSYKDNLNLNLVDIACFVYIGDGMFHPSALLLAQENEENFKDVIVVNVVENSIQTITKSEVEKIFKKRKGNLLKFHISKNIGVFISSKWGQEFEKSSLKLKKIWPEKNFYFFIGDNFIEQEMENFPFVECWVNSACPRIGQDDVLRQRKAVVNISDIWK